MEGGKLTLCRPRRLALFALLLVLLPRSAGSQDASGWPYQYQAGPFLCHADFPLQDYRPVLARMAQLQQDLVTTLHIRPAPENIYLFWFQKRATYQNYVGYYFPQVPERRALFIKARGPGMVFAYRHSEFEIDVMHESTHALLHAALPLVPLWLDEGLAEYFEVPPEQRVYGHPHLNAIKWRVQLGGVPDVERLESLGDLDGMGRSEYRDAWAWVHFMLHGPPEAREELLGYLADIQAHAPPGQLSRRLRQRMPNVESRFAEHFQTWRQL